MPSTQGDLALLNDPIAEKLLQSTIPARLAYNWTDGTPRVVPIWFHWNGKEIVVVSPPKAPKLRAIRNGAQLALTIDSDDFPHRVLMMRGTAAVSTVDGMCDEYASAAERYFGEEQGKAWVKNVASMTSTMGRIAITPTWVGILDFQTRFPSAISA